MTFPILGILWLQKWGIPFATLSYSILQKTWKFGRKFFFQILNTDIWFFFFQNLFPPLKKPFIWLGNRFQRVLHQLIFFDSSKK